MYYYYRPFAVIETVYLHYFCCICMAVDVNLDSKMGNEAVDEKMYVKYELNVI